MKRILLLSSALCLIIACSSDELDCHECHIAFLNANNVEIEYELGEYCESELEDLEQNGYNLTEEQVVGNDTIPAAMYDPSDIHCEEHHDHEDE